MHQQHRYILTSNKTAGEIEIVYVDGLIRAFNTIEFTVNEKSVNFFLDNIPRDEQGVDIFVKQYNAQYKPNVIKIERADLDIDFDAFWEAYNKKVNKKRCEPLWKKLSLQKRLKAYNRIKDYNRYLDRSGIAKLDPENYLRYERFDDEGW